MGDHLISAKSHPDQQNRCDGDPSPGLAFFQLYFYFGVARGNDLEFALRDQLDVFCEPVATPGYGHDVLMVLWTLAQCLTQQENITAEVGFFDERVGPDGFQEFILVAISFLWRISTRRT